MVRMIKNTVVASRTLKSNLTNKLLDMMTSDWFLKFWNRTSRTSIREEITKERSLSFFQTIRSRAQVPLTINPGSQGSRGFRIAERAPSLRRNIFRLRLGGRKPPFAASRIGQRPCLEFAHRHAVHQADRPLDPHAIRTAVRTLRGLLHARTGRSETQQSEQRGYDSGIHILSSIGHVSCRIHRQIYA